MSHEIRTPLNAVIGLADIFDRSNLSTDQVKSLETIRYSAGVLMGVLTDILDFSKIESGKLERVDKPFSLREALKQIVSIFENDATQKGVLLTCKTDPNLPNMLTGDEVRVRQIILNLCSNAIKFSGSDKNEGRVSICARLVDNVEEKNWFEVLVEDNGIGIDQAGMEKLFKPFSQVDASTSRKYGGTGLGLSISQQLSELLGGSISCKSEVGNGSCFTLRLPFQSATGEKKEAAGEVSPMPDWVRGLKVLIAEDNPINQMVIRKQITKLGMNAHVVDNGLQALEYYRNNKVDLLLTDCHMPELDGYGLSEQIRALEKSEQLPRLPIIAITADAVVGAETYEAANLDAYLVKPVSLVALRRAIMARANFLIKANKAS
jgi:CheY-like chemotaxis protein/anti-sigma regulatory factor (Ser/Thr protein kinase)